MCLEQVGSGMLSKSDRTNQLEEGVCASALDAYCDELFDGIFDKGKDIATDAINDGSANTLA